MPPSASGVLELPTSLFRYKLHVRSEGSKNQGRDLSLRLFTLSSERPQSAGKVLIIDV